MSASLKTIDSGFNVGIDLATQRLAMHVRHNHRADFAVTLKQAHYNNYGPDAREVSFRSNDQQLLDLLSNIAKLALEKSQKQHAV